MKWVILASFLCCCVVLPARVAYRTGRFRRVWMTAWGALIVWFFIMSFFVGPMLGDDPALADTLPEGNSVVAALATGWLPSFVLAGIAMVISRLFGGAITPSPSPSES